MWYVSTTSIMKELKKMLFYVKANILWKNTNPKEERKRKLGREPDVWG